MSAPETPAAGWSPRCRRQAALPPPGPSPGRRGRRHRRRLQTARSSTSAEDLWSLLMADRDAVTQLPEGRFRTRTTSPKAWTGSGTPAPWPGIPQGGSVSSTPTALACDADGYGGNAGRSPCRWARPRPASGAWRLPPGWRDHSRRSWCCATARSPPPCRHCRRQTAGPSWRPSPKSMMSGAYSSNAALLYAENRGTRVAPAPCGLCG